MRIKKTIRLILALFLCSCVLISIQGTTTSASVSSLSYSTLQELNTEKGSLKLGEGTVFDEESALNNIDGFVLVKPASAENTDLTVYSDMEGWSSYSQKISDLSFTFELYLKELAPFREDEDGKISAVAGFKGDKVTYYWNFDDVVVNRGKNTVFLNFRTANKIFTDEKILSLFPESDQGTAVAEPQIEQASDPTQRNKKTGGLEDYSYYNTNRFFISIKKVSDSGNAVFGIGKAKIVSFSLEQTDDKIVLETEKLGKEELSIAVVVVAALIISIAAVVFVPVYKKNKRKRR